MTELGWYYVYLTGDGHEMDLDLPGRMDELVARKAAEALNAGGWLRDGVEARVDSDLAGARADSDLPPRG